MARMVTTISLSASKLQSMQECGDMAQPDLKLEETPDRRERYTGEERRKVWSPENAITESALIVADKNNAIRTLRIERVGAANRVFIQLTWRKDELFLTTTRRFDRPREFKNFERLVDYVQHTLHSVICFSVDVKYAGQRDRRRTIKPA
jgi:hypothetical protein